MKGCKLRKLVDFLQYFISDAYGFIEYFPAVYYTVTDSFDFIKRRNDAKTSELVQEAF